MGSDAFVEKCKKPVQYHLSNKRLSSNSVKNKIHVLYIDVEDILFDICFCDEMASLRNTLVQRSSGILSACNMRISNSKLCESSKC